MAYDSLEVFAQRYGIALFGCATDGNVNFDGINPVVVAGQTVSPVAGVYTLSFSVIAARVTVGAGVEIRTAGNIIRCWELVGDATSVISDNGNDAVGGVAGVGLTAATLPNGRTSASGGAGRATVGAGLAGGTVNNALGGTGGSGGDSGASVGGAGGATTPPDYPLRGPLAAYGPSVLRLFNSGTSIQGGGGGRGGAMSTLGGTSGAGGGGGGCVYVNAATWDFAGTLRARGGAGGNAAGSDSGGGGGGGGGCVFIVVRQFVRAPSYDTSGGAGGAGFGIGLPGGMGFSGQAVAIQAP